MVLGAQFDGEIVHQLVVEWFAQDERSLERTDKVHIVRVRTGQHFVFDGGKWSLLVFVDGSSSLEDSATNAEIIWFVKLWANVMRSMCYLVPGTVTSERGSE